MMNFASKLDAFVADEKVHVSGKDQGFTTVPFSAALRRVATCGYQHVAICACPWFLKRVSCTGSLLLVNAWYLSTRPVAPTQREVT